MSIDVVEAARHRLEVLATEMRQLEAFIEMSERLASGLTGPIASDALRPSRPGSRHVPGSPRPREIVAAVQAILSPDAILDRHELVERLREEGISMTGADPAKNLGTILWRNRDVFEHVHGRGYRLTGPSMQPPPRD